MADEGISTRPESPKKKIKSNTVTHSEAEPSNYPDYNMNVDRCNGAAGGMLNGMVAPTRQERLSELPDSSSDPRQGRMTANFSPNVVQEEEVSSSENSVGKKKEPEDQTTICDSASIDSAADYSPGKR